MLILCFLKYFQDSLKLNRELGNDLDIANSLSWIGKIYFDSNKKFDALKYLMIAKSIYEELDLKDKIKEVQKFIDLIFSNF